MIEALQTFGFFPFFLTWPRLAQALERLRRMNSPYRKHMRQRPPNDDDTDEHAVAVPVNDPLLAALRREHPERG
jgi:hypothetical protein